MERFPVTRSFQEAAMALPSLPPFNPSPLPLSFPFPSAVHLLLSSSSSIFRHEAYENQQPQSQAPLPLQEGPLRRLPLRPSLLRLRNRVLFLLRFPPQARWSCRHSNQRPAATPTSVLPGDRSEFSSVDMAQAFRLIDRDNDGVVSRTELEALLKRLLGAEPPTQEEVAMMLSEVDGDGDGDGDGCIPLEALLHRFGPGCEPAGDSELREAFEVFDTDHDGKISAEELLRVFTAIGDERCTLEECRHMIAEVDKNGDGFVCFQDFARMMDLQR